jgi:acyl-CoA reductase-like NAD-dependent aldehyde dehydrogenase
MSITFRYQNYIDGCWVAAKDARSYEIRNPADWRQVLHSYPLSSKELLAQAIEGAASAQQSWRRVPSGEKAAIFRRVSRLIQENRDQLARTITDENGKLIQESHAEINSAILELEYQIGEGERQMGSAGDCLGQGLRGFTRKEPIGVVSAITPWNFPFNVPFRKLIPALFAGNTAVLKSAAQTTAVGEAVIHLFIEAGLPAGVLQFVTGSGSELSDTLVGHPAVRAVTFTGSTEVGRIIAQKAACTFTRTQLEMGGKNPMVVLGDADMELAATDAVIAAFSCAGQWCTATSRLIVTKDIADELIDGILSRIDAIRVGAGTNEATTMGPVCGMTQLKDILDHIETARNQGGKFIAGGDRFTDGELAHGCFINPTLIDAVTDDMDIAKTEVFGPVLSVMRVRNYQDALILANDIPYGLSSSIYTRDLERAMHFVENSEVGMSHVNVHSAYKEPQFCFGGVKESGFGLPEAGSTGIQFFQEEKAVYVRSQTPSPR